VADMVNRLCDYKAQHAEMKRELGYSVFLFCFALLCCGGGDNIYGWGEERPRIRGLLMVEERKEKRRGREGFYKENLKGSGLSRVCLF